MVVPRGGQKEVDTHLQSKGIEFVFGVRYLPMKQFYFPIYKQESILVDIVNRGIRNNTCIYQEFTHTLYFAYELIFHSC